MAEKHPRASRVSAASSDGLLTFPISSATPSDVNYTPRPSSYDAAAPPPPATLSLLPPKKKKRRKRTTQPLVLVRIVFSVFRAFPVFNPRCNCVCCWKNPTAPLCVPVPESLNHPRSAITGTLFGCRRGKVSLSLQESPNSLPTVIVELGIHTHVLFKELSSGMARIALECEKQHAQQEDPWPTTTKKKRGGLMMRTKRKKQQKKKEKRTGKDGELMEEALWTVFLNGRKGGYGVRREANEEDLGVMALLRGVSMGGGVLPGRSDADGEVAYMRAGFQHVVGSRDSETLYLISPDGDGGNGPDLTIFFVRV